jgi:hydroxyacylglutathione hydrolase
MLSRFVPYYSRCFYDAPVSRLYVRDAHAFTASAVRTAAFVERLGPTRASSLRVLGCHIEMTSTAGVDYPTGTLYQPCEAPYALTAEHVADVARRCVAALRDSDNSGTLPRIVCDRYIVEPVG